MTFTCGCAPPTYCPTHRPLVRAIEAIDHPCHDVCFHDLHADCQCAAWIRQEAIIAVLSVNLDSRATPTRRER